VNSLSPDNLDTKQICLYTMVHKTQSFPPMHSGGTFFYGPRCIFLINLAKCVFVAMQMFLYDALGSRNLAVNIGQ